MKVSRANKGLVSKILMKRLDDGLLPEMEQHALVFFPPFPFCNL